MGEGQVRWKKKGGEGVWERVIPEEEHLFVGLRRDFEGYGVVRVQWKKLYGGGGPAFSPRHSPISNIQSKVK